jgi:hypothetical protein
MSKEKSRSPSIAARRKRPALLHFPAEGTQAALAFVKAAVAGDRFFHFIIDTVLHGDYFGYAAKQALDGKVEYKTKDVSDLALTNPGPRTRFLRANSQALLEMFVSRLVDSFQKYLVDVIRDVLHSKPSILSTRQQSLTLEELLKYERIEDLVHDVIERKVNSLSYEGFTDLEKWCADRGIPIKVPGARRAAVVELIATRNIIAHNRGLVDERYARTVRASKFQVGACRVLDVDYFFEASSLLKSIVFKTDDAVRDKFGLPAVKTALPTSPQSRSEMPSDAPKEPNGHADCD